MVYIDLHKTPNPILFLADKIVKFHPALEGELKLANMEYNSRQYGVLLVRQLFMLFFLLSAFSILAAVMKGQISDLPLFILGSLIISFLALFPFLSFPKNQAAKREKLINLYMPDLIILTTQCEAAGDNPVKIMKKIAGAGMGEISEIFKEATSRIRLGERVADIIKWMINTNPSNSFKKYMDKLSSKLTQGGDIRKDLTTLLIENAKLNKHKFEIFGAGTLKILVTQFLFFVGVFAIVGYIGIFAAVGFGVLQKSSFFVAVGIMESIKLSVTLLIIGNIKVRLPVRMEE